MVKLEKKDEEGEEGKGKKEEQGRTRTRRMSLLSPTIAAITNSYAPITDQQSVTQDSSI